jgi:multidrug efflux pump subunit AcrB
VVLNDRAYTIRVRFPESTRALVDAIKSTVLVSSTGRTGTLGTLATVEDIPGQTELRRENLQGNVTVSARLEGVDLGAGVAAAQRAVADLHLPPAIRVSYGGAYEEQQKSFKDLLFVLVVAVVLVFTVLLFEFGDVAAPTAVIASALLSTVGVFLALWSRGPPSISRRSWASSWSSASSRRTGSCCWTPISAFVATGVARGEHDSRR